MRRCPRWPSPRTRVAIVTTNFHPTVCGVGDHSLRMASELRRRSVAVRVFAQGPADVHPEDPSVEVRSCPGFTPLATARALLRALSDWGATHALIQYVPHALRASRFGSPAVPLLCRALRRRGVRVTVFAHELYLPWSVRPDIALGAALNRLQLAAVLTWADRLVITTESRVRTFLPWARLVGHDDRLRLLPVGSNAVPVPAKEPSGGLALGTFSSRTPNKRFDVLLDAFAVVAQRVPAATLLLVGDEGDPTTAASREFAARLARHPAADRIRRAGRVSLADAARLVSQLDAFLFGMDVGATTRSGTLPLPLGAGVPVVAHRGADTGSLFVADENVVFARELSGAAFAEAILRLHGDPVLRRRVVQGGRGLYEEHLSWERIGDALSDALSLSNDRNESRAP